ncbi:hypothetical protein HPB47_010329 [Ixodes persulcatus]|uniref:Uncharacterized protein n=1 Tax=Ixodes persulcatus TaxID=34615 RepID=A0AC60NZM4_IXOPE|nr:hypothetical protein HPB47_010329 [Ixodes persulcatus]
MAYCCVPNFCSNAKKKIWIVHDIPADEELSKWIVVLRSDNWTPNTTSNYSKVCSKHFKETDFLEGKYRCLKKGTVPLVFECYPFLLQLKSRNERVVAPKCLEVAANTVNQFQQVCVPTTRDQGTQADCRTAPSSLVLKRRKWQQKECDLKKQVERQQKTVDSYKEELQKLREYCHVASLSYINERAAEKQHSAIFLLEQISNFSQKRPCWSEETIRHSIALRHL